MVSSPTSVLSQCQASNFDVSQVTKRITSIICGMTSVSEMTSQ